MCEMLAVALDRPQPFAHLSDRVCGLERWGLGGFGWGVAWQTEDGRVRVERGLGRFQDEALSRDDLLHASSSRFLVHLRRPNKLSTVQLADTQPFPGDEGSCAFCHNGFLEGAEQRRPEFGDQLRGGADSEVGWVFLKACLARGMSPENGLRQVDATFGGTLNLGYLDGTGLLLVYAHNKNNGLWKFRLAEGGVPATVVSSALHSDDETLFDVIFPDATNRLPVPTRRSVAVGSTRSQGHNHNGPRTAVGLSTPAGLDRA